jgi:hypothetical protein
LIRRHPIRHRDILGVVKVYIAGGVLVLLLLVAVWGLWPLCGVVDRKRTMDENRRIFFGVLVLAIIACLTYGYLAAADFANGFESR